MTRALRLHAIESKTSAAGCALHIPLHRHQQMAELLWVESGELELTVAGERRTVRPGALVLIPAGEWCALSFPPCAEQRWRKLLVTHAAGSVNDKICISYCAHPDFLASLFEELARNMEQTAAASSRKAQLLLDWLWVSVTQSEAVAEFPPNGSKMKRIVHKMEETCHLPFSLGETAETEGLSKFHFSRQFKEICGQTPLQFVISCRMDRAKELLLTTQQAVADIARICGYKSATQFHAAFTRHMGSTPKRFREQQQNQEAR
ncbi:MAG: AraC family transcriptional regulator [Bacillota bacterium]